MRKAAQDVLWWIAAAVLSLMLMLPADSPALASAAAGRRVRLVEPNATDCNRTTVAEFGATSVAKRIAELQLTFAEGDEIVFVPGLGLHFLAGRRDGRVVVAPFSDIADTNLRRGFAVDAGEAFLQLVPRARRYELEADTD